jgi:hypothetical protein
METDPVKHLNPEELANELRYFPTLLYQLAALAVQFLPPDAAGWKFFVKN